MPQGVRPRRLFLHLKWCLGEDLMKASDLGCLWVVVGPAAAVLLVFGAAIAAGIAATIIALLLVAALAAGVALIPPILAGLTLMGLTVAVRHSVRGGSRGWAAVE